MNVFLILFFLILPSKGPGTVDGKMFLDDTLNHPQKHQRALESSFTLIETEINPYIINENTILLENGYASFKIIPSVYIDSLKYNKRNIEKVSLIFTKYPYHKKDWITNYHYLLAMRLKELFKINPMLNSSNIEWEIIYQTAGKTADQAKRMFHGIAIHLKKRQASVIVPQAKEEKEHKNALQDTNTHRAKHFPVPTDVDMGRFSLSQPLTPLPPELKEKAKAKKPRNLPCPRWK